jgi:AbrB family looped-hinge helix DNA binding protein
MSEQTVVGKRHTIVVPKSVRERVSLKEGQDVLVRAEGSKIIIEPLPENPYEILEKVIGRPYEEKRDERAAERWVKRRAGH